MPPTRITGLDRLHLSLRRLKLNHGHGAVVIGSVNGQIREVFKKLALLHAKQNFATALLVGDLFAAEETANGVQDEETVNALLNGEIDVPLTTYFALGRSALPPRVVEKLSSSDSGELCSNLYFLGKRTTIKTSEGIRIVALGGSIDRNSIATGSKDKYAPVSLEGDASALKGASSADFLITGEWPGEIRVGSNRPGAHQICPDQPGQRCISDLCGALKPRYHFSTSETFFEREPFFFLKDPPATISEQQNSKTDKEGYKVTRFVSLAPFNNPSKQKWIYAFSYDPKSSDPISVPEGTTVSPFLQFTKRPNRRDMSNRDPSTFSRFSTETSDHYSNGRQSKKRRRNEPPPGPDNCFFCLSNPALAEHLVLSIGENAYLAGAKGPLPITTPSNATFPSLVADPDDATSSFPAHILVIPLPHAPTLSTMSPADRAATVKEMTTYRRAVCRMIASKSNGELGAVAWEVSRERGIHTHWQIMPAKAESVRSGLVDTAFRVHAKNEQYPKFRATLSSDEIPTDGDRSNGDDKVESSSVDYETNDCFQVWTWRAPDPDEEIEWEKSGKDGRPPWETKIVMPLSEGEFRFDLTMGRKVMAKLLGMEDRVQWRDCEQGKGEETSEAEAFKKAFEGFDPAAA